MNLACARLQSLLPLAVESELDESARAAVVDHVGDCPECADLLSFYSQLRDELQSDPLASPPPVYFEGTLAEIHRDMHTATPIRVPSPRRRLGRQQLASVAMSGLFAIWLITGLSAWMPLDGMFQSRDGHRSIRPKPALTAASTAGQRPNRLVAVEGFGLVLEDSPILRMPRSMLEDLGLTRCAWSGRKGGPRRLLMG